MPEEKKENPKPSNEEAKKSFKKSAREWKPDTSQILTIEESLQKLKKEEKKEK